MAELKTKVNRKSVVGFIKKVKDEGMRKDCFSLVKLMKKITKSEGKMWGTNIVGFGNIKYKYASGREGEWMLIGFSPRKNALSIYSCLCNLKENPILLKNLGKYKHSVSCIYVKKLEDINLKVLERLLRKSIIIAKKKYS
jgi:hypothetical protein